MSQNLPKIQNNYSNPFQKFKGNSVNYTILNFLKKGKQSCVYLAKSSENFSLYVIKQILLPIATIKQFRAHQELNILLKCEHPNIIKVENAFEKNNSLNIVFKFSEFGNLEDHISSLSKIHKKLPEENVWLIANQLALAIQTLKFNLIVHRHIKPSNILIFQDGLIKLGGFSRALELKEDKLSSKISNTIHYDLKMDNKDNQDFDLLSLGRVLMYVMINEFPSIDTKNDKLNIYFSQLENEKYYSTQLIDYVKIHLNKRKIAQITPSDSILLIPMHIRLLHAAKYKDANILRKVDFIISKIFKPRFKSINSIQNIQLNERSYSSNQRKINHNQRKVYLLSIMTSSFDNYKKLRDKNSAKKFTNKKSEKSPKKVVSYLSLQNNKNKINLFKGRNHNSFLIHQTEKRKYLPDINRIVHHSNLSDKGFRNRHQSNSIPPEIQY